MNYLCSTKRKTRKAAIFWSIFLLYPTYIILLAHLPATCAPIEGNESMAELTTDDQKPLQLSDRSDIKHVGREFFIKGYQAQRSGQWLLAATQYQKAIDSNPDMSEAFWNLGLCFEQDGKLEKAKDAFATSLKIDWSNALVYKHLAYLSFKLGDASQGGDYLRKYLHR